MISLNKLFKNRRFKKMMENLLSVVGGLTILAILFGLFYYANEADNKRKAERKQVVVECLKKYPEELLHIQKHKDIVERCWRLDVVNQPPGDEHVD